MSVKPTVASLSAQVETLGQMIEGLNAKVDTLAVALDALVTRPSATARVASAASAPVRAIANRKPKPEPTTKPASDKQKKFLRTLLGERIGNPDAETIRADLNERLSSLTSADANVAITALMAITKNVVVEEDEAVGY